MIAVALQKCVFRESRGENIVEKIYDQTVILEQWKTCVSMADSVSKRRDTVNKLFVTFNSALLVLMFQNKTNTVLLIGLGILICLIWYCSINNYRILNSAKFEVILKLEESFQIKPFSDEWECAKKNNYKRITKIEQLLPIVFISLYISLDILNYFCGGAIIGI